MWTSGPITLFIRNEHEYTISIALMQLMQQMACFFLFFIRRVILKEACIRSHKCHLILSLCGGTLCGSRAYSPLSYQNNSN